MSSAHVASSLVLAGTLSLLACGGPSAVDGGASGDAAARDAGAGMDAGVGMDGGRRPDGGSALDGAVADAGAQPDASDAPDGAPVPDGGPADGGASDPCATTLAPDRFDIDTDVPEIVGGVLLLAPCEGGAHFAAAVGRELGAVDLSLFSRDGIRFVEHPVAVGLHDVAGLDGRVDASGVFELLHGDGVGALQRRRGRPGAWTHDVIPGTDGARGVRAAWDGASGFAAFLTAEGAIRGVTLDAAGTAVEDVVVGPVEAVDVALTPASDPRVVYATPLEVGSSPTSFSTEVFVARRSVAGWDATRLGALSISFVGLFGPRHGPRVSAAIAGDGVLHAAVAIPEDPAAGTEGRLRVFRWDGVTVTEHTITAPTQGGAVALDTYPSDDRPLVLHQRRDGLRGVRWTGTEFAPFPLGDPGTLHDFRIGPSDAANVLTVYRGRAVWYERSWIDAARPFGSPPCTSCAASTECARGSSCVSIAGEARCYPLRAAAEGGDCASLRPYHTAVTLPDTEGASVDVCFPSASCEAVRAYGHDCGGGCGAGGICTAPGCTLTCERDEQCPRGASCDTTLGVCSTP